MDHRSSPPRGAGASVNTMELAAGPATGTLSGFGTSFTNFGVLTVDAGASWRFTSNTIGSGVTLTNSGRLSNAGPSGVIDTAVTLTAGAYLYNQAGGIINVAATAVKAIGSAATILNRGSIQGTTGPAMYLTAAGSIVVEGTRFSAEGGNSLRFARTGQNPIILDATTALEELLR